MDIGHLRREYQGRELTRDSLASEPFSQFEQWFQQAQQAEVQDPSAMTLATVSATGQPSARTVLLKQYDDSGFVFFTNLESQKAQHIQHNSQVALLFTWLELNRQIKIEGVANKISHAESLRYFLSRPQESQWAAWASPQSQTISSRQILEEKFFEIKQKFSQGKIPLPSFWGGYRVVPKRIEFWQGRENRLHDRFSYNLDQNANQSTVDKAESTAWSINRLAP